MSGKLKSHSHLYLYQHIKEIKTAVEGILRWHSQETITPQIKDLLNKSIAAHDLGKGSQAFQEYISAPEQYCGKREDKTHTPLSLLITLALAQEESWDALTALAVAAVVKGHHSRLPTIPKKRLGEIDSIRWDIDNFASGNQARVLKRQLLTLPFDSLEAEVGFDFSTKKFIAALKNDSGANISKLKRMLNKIIKSDFWSMTEEAAVDFRLKVQLVYSILLEADKAFLAISDPKRYLQRPARQWQLAWIEKRIGKVENNFVNNLRQRARKKILQAISDYSLAHGRIFSLTAPTGIGKTLLAASWAFEMYNIMSRRQAVKPKIIVVLPFLSIIEQTAKEYEKLLKLGGYISDGTWLVKSHSLAERNYAEWLEEKEETFFIDTWHSEMIVTTYDQFLMSLMDPKSKYQMRFHNLCDSIIIMDEVQSLPCKLWQPLDKIFTSLAKIGNSKLLLMSATLPAFVSNQEPLLPDYQKYFKSFKRYKFKFRLQEKILINDFCKELTTLLPQWLKNNERVLITMNTRKSALVIRDSLAEAWPHDYCDTPLIFISADVTPYDRLKAVERIKEGNPCIVVSTQCIEAGVDIDMDLVFRDFAPLDSLIQIAGRCNREWKTPERKYITVVDIANQQGWLYSEMIYDLVHLQTTRELLVDKWEISEEDILDISTQYFESLSKKKDTGREHLYRFVYWQEDVPIRELLRGEQHEQHTFLILEQDVKLEEDMRTAAEIENRWERREAWKKLASRMAMVSVNVYAKKDFSPGWIAEPAPFLDNYWLVREGVYSTSRGLQMEDDVSQQIL